MHTDSQSSLVEEHDHVTISLSLSLDGELWNDYQQLSFDIGHAEDYGVIDLADKMTQSIECGQEKSTTGPVCKLLSEDERESLKLIAEDNSSLTAVVKFLEHRKEDKLIRAFQAFRRAIKLLKGSKCVDKPQKASDDCLQPDPTSIAQEEARNILSLSLTNASLCLLELCVWAEDTPECVVTGKERSDLIHWRQQLTHNYRLAVTYCNMALSIDPTYAKTWQRLSKAHAGLHDYSQAISAGQRYLKLLIDSDDPDISSFHRQRQIDTARARIDEWRDLSNEQLRKQRKRVAGAFKRFCESHESSSEDEEPLEIGTWSNELADPYMSLHDELEAFGETMPERRHRPHKSSRKTAGAVDLTDLSEMDEDADNQ